MNIKTNKHEYIEHNGCHNCRFAKLLEEVCGIDGIKVALWGVCKKWEEAEENEEEWKMKKTLVDFKVDLLYDALINSVKSLDSEDIKNKLLTLIGNNHLTGSQFNFLMDSLGIGGDNTEE